MTSFIDQIDAALKNADFSNRVAFVFKSQTWTFAQVADALTATEKWLASECGKGDPIAALTSNCVEAVLLEWATYRIGGTWIGIPTLERDLGNLERLLDDFAPRLLLVEPGALGRFDLATLQSFPRSPYEEKQRLPEQLDSSRLRLLRRADEGRPSGVFTLGGKPVARIRYTSGATGEPKAIAYTERTTTAILDNILAVIVPTEEETVVIGLPLVWAAGSLIAPAFCRGAKTVLLPRWDLSDFVEAVAREKRTLTFLVPAQVADLTRYSEQSGTGWAHGLGRVLVAGGPTSLLTMRRARETLPGVTFYITLGQTEASFPITLHEVTPRDVDPAKNPRLFVPLGKLTVPYEESVIDAETGELKLRGSAVAAGRWVREKRRFVPFDLPHPTGDLVEQDATGILHYLGRVRELENVLQGWPAPEAIEALIRDSPGVRRARVDGLNADGGVVRAAVTIEPIAERIDAGKLREFFNERRAQANLAEVAIGSIRFGDVPLTMSGKTRRISGYVKDWREFDLSCLADGPLYFYVGAGLSVSAGLVGWNEMASLIWRYLKYYERLPDSPSSPPDDAESNARFLQSFVKHRDDTGAPILSRESNDRRGLGRMALLNMMLRYRAPRLRYVSAAGEARFDSGAPQRQRPGEQPDAEDLVLHSLIWRAGCGGALTSNYDMLLEHAYSLFHHGSALRSYRYNAAFLRYVLSNRHFVLKLHGDINDFATMELDPDGAWTKGGRLNDREARGRDLENVYGAMLRRGHMVYVGCGFRDRTIDALHGSWRLDEASLRNCRVALIPLQEADAIPRARFSQIEFLTFGAGWYEVREFLEAIVAARRHSSREQQRWKPCPEASDLHEQVFLARTDAELVRRLRTRLWSCEGEGV